jgi:ankyrin repeat protein
LISRGEDPNQDKDDWEKSPLGIAAYYGHDDAVVALVDGGADVEQQLSNFEKVRLWAASIGRESSYLSADRAIKMLKKSQTKQQQSRKQQ